VLRLRVALSASLAALRSVAFLSTFVSSFWFAVCSSRTLLLARLLPQISHDFWDGPYGCVLAGCLTCGSSIWIENGRRRGEMALYVLPRAIRTCLPNAWVGSGSRMVRAAERSVHAIFLIYPSIHLLFWLTISIVFITSLASLLTAATHRPDSLRGLSRWVLAFVTNGPNAGFWKRKQHSVTSIPATPSIPSTPAT